jgi:hypothetical protein
MTIASVISLMLFVRISIKILFPLDRVIYVT